MTPSFSPEALAHSFLSWLNQYDDLPRHRSCDGFRDEVLSTLYCSLPSYTRRVPLSPTRKAACFVNVMMVASGFLTMTPDSFCCNDGFVDSFCRPTYSDRPLLENIELVERQYLSDAYVLSKVSGRLFLRNHFSLTDSLSQLLLTVASGQRSCQADEYLVYQFTLELLADIQEARYYLAPREEEWDPEAWLKVFLPAWNARNRSAQHTIRAAYYRRHMELVKRGSYRTSGGKTVSIPHDARQAMSCTRHYRQELHPQPPTQPVKTQFAVYNEDCLVVAKRLQEAFPDKTAVLNLANRQTPGGGVYTGSGAQEESCFLRSNYFLFLYPFASFAAMHGLPEGPVSYPMDRDFGGNYCEGVTVFRGKELEGYPLLEEPWQTNFIAVAALNRPELTSTDTGELRICDRLVPAALHKIRTVLNIAIDNHVQTLVLGAMGCGAFRNPPKHMAELFSQVLREPAYHNRFKRIVFAVLGDDNYLPFLSVFGTQPEPL